MHFKSETKYGYNRYVYGRLYSNPVPIYISICTYIHVFVIYICMLRIFLIIYISVKKTYPKTFSDLNVFIAHDIVFIYIVYIYLYKAITPCRISSSVYPVLKILRCSNILSHIT